MSTSKLNHSHNDLDPSEQADAEQVREAYRAALQEEPRAMIDDAIRAASRRAAGAGVEAAGPMSVKKGWASRWATPLAAAATVMITSSVVFMAVQDRPELASSVLPPTAYVVLPERSKPVVPPIVGPSVAEPPTSAELANDLMDKKDKFDGAKVSTQSGLAAGAPSSKPASTPASSTPKSPQPSVSLAAKLSAPEPPPPPKLAIASEAEMRTKLPAQSFTSKAEIASPNASNREAPSGAAVQLPSGLPTSAASEQPLSTARQQRSRSSAAGSLDVGAATSADGKISSAAMADVPARAIPASPEPISSAPAPPVQLAQPVTSALESQTIVAAKLVNNNAIESADVWITRMLLLKRLDKNKELAEEISRFRKRYPDVELPKELNAAQD